MSESVTSKKVNDEEIKKILYLVMKNLMKILHLVMKKFLD